MAKHLVEDWKQGDTFENDSGGWKGSVVAVEGSKVLVRYWGEDPRNIISVSIDSIKRPDSYVRVAKHADA